MLDSMVENRVKEQAQLQPVKENAEGKNYLCKKDSYYVTILLIYWKLFMRRKFSWYTNYHD